MADNILSSLLKPTQAFHPVLFVEAETVCHIKQMTGKKFKTNMKAAKKKALKLDEVEYPFKFGN